MRPHGVTGAPPYGAFLFLAAFGTYAMTAAPDITFWDSGELVTAAYSLGIPHQPGYPLYSIVARASSLLPVGNVAFRANILSGLAAALSVWMLYASVRILLAGRDSEPGPLDSLAAAAVAALFGASKALWSQAAVAEVYTLNAMFMASLLYLHLLNARGRIHASRYVSLSGFLLGLGIVNHISVGMLLPGIAASWWYALSGDGRRSRRAITGLSFSLLGASVLLYLPVRSAALPYINIGHPDTLHGFLWTSRWSEYLSQSQSLLRSAGGHVTGLASDAPHLAIGVAGLFVLCAVAWTLLRAWPRAYLPVILFTVVYVPVTAGIAAGSARDVGFGLHEKFFIPAVLFALVILSGLLGTMSTAGRDGRRAAVRYAFTGLCAPCLAFLVSANLPATDYHRHFIAYDYAQNSLKSTGERGVLLTWGDNGVFPLWYVQSVERYRDDVLLAHTPLMTYDWYLSDLNRRAGRDIQYMEPYFLGENAYRVMKAEPGRPFSYDYSTVHNLELEDSGLTPRGIVYFEGYVPPGDPWDWFVFRGAVEKDVPMGKLENNILQIYTYMARQEPADG